ncbi:helix-turn-helix domain-containing protein [Streptomyces sp. NPDC005426]|uniref:helix-turn-helix domain-containing protein n=1 Tax=Streptomyces sp. NPDC005426 TaxID=3155344 RepID=UPI0033AAB1F2
MSTSAWPEENWAVLGETIARARRAKGWDQAALAERSGNSPNTISNYERGRATRSRRIPTGLRRVAQVFGWPPDAVDEILSGGDPALALSQPTLGFDLEGHDESSLAATPINPPRLMSARDIEVTNSGYQAQDTFLRQMKRYRKLKGVTLETMVSRLAALGWRISLEDLTQLESGMHPLKVAECENLAAALGTDMQWLLASGFQESMPPEMTAPLTDEELQAEAKATERRMFEVGAQLNQAVGQHVQAVERAEMARREAEMALVLRQQVSAQKAELERQYHYLIGRIDSLRAARGEDQIFQTYPVMVEEDETVGEKLAQARERSRLSPEDVQALTRIRPAILEAIEKNRFEAVTGDSEHRDVYARGYIRTLAKTYKINPEPLISEYDEQFGDTELPGQLKQWSKLEEATGVQHRPRKRGVGFVRTEKMRDETTPGGK